MEKLKSILHESVLMKSLHHDNILKILGVCLETDVQGGMAYIVLPYMVNGDLKTYLKNKRQSTITRITPGFSQPVSCVCITINLQQQLGKKPYFHELGYK